MSHTTHRRSDASPAADGADADADAETVLALSGITKTYGPETAVDDLSMSVVDGEILALLGPSGCGKTTTLRMIAGLERADDGTIELGGRTLADADAGAFVPPEEHDIGLVFQDFALFPHLNAAENVAFGIDDRPAEEREARVAQLLELVGLGDHAEHYPEELSGGQKQRIALARSLAPEPDVLLLDEPLSNLDVALRVSMREEMRRIIDETGVTAIWVTHDQEEALSIADRVGVMNDGRLQQIGRPERIFERPTSRFVASFLGQAGFLTGRVDGDAVETDIGRLDAAHFPGLDLPDGTTIDVLVRPDDLQARPAADEATADGRLTQRQYQGPSFVYRVETTEGDSIHCMHNHTELFDVGRPVTVDVVADHPLQWFER
ncbi:iron(III) transport system ATP-binding protein [Halarchaeum solikamskense]|uniref:ABC transporter ATP-binding protein n=1 Tax=Halarchaeum nitratireducens TaxID=489913 RepID=UPI001B3AA035|nr:ABC transporter ATP-binding protein [Halarchaeum solikamskense]MBP2249898.1 iron(III) transport system ATP-binding protein [Halarchaeum solikamskense]